jgi:uracil phosphoribosyltransferase
MNDFQQELLQEHVTEMKEQTEELAEIRKHLKRIGDLLDKFIEEVYEP